MFTDRGRIGLGLCLSGAGFLAAGVALLLDRGLLALGNLQLVSGLVLAVGPSHAASFFLAAGRRTASALLAAGLALCLCGHVSAGLLVELLGLVQLLGDMGGLLFAVLRALPVLGPAASAARRAGVRFPHVVAALVALAAAPPLLGLLAGTRTAGGAAGGRVAAVLGGTGAQGGAAARALLETGRFAEVRTLSRRPASDEAAALRAEGVRVLPGSPADREALDALLDGAGAVFAVTLTRDDPADEVREAAALADALRDAAPSCVVLSGGDAVPGSARLGAKHAVELEFRRRGLPAVYLHTALFMDSLAARASGGVLRAPLEPDVAVPLLASADVGRAAARLLAVADARGCPRAASVGDEDELAAGGTVVKLAGDVATPRELARALGLEYRQVTVDEAAGGGAPPVVREMYEWYRRGHPGHARDTRHLGRLGTRSVAQWAADERARRG